MITDIVKVKRVRKSIPVKFYEELTKADIADLQETIYKPLHSFLDLEWKDGTPYRVSVR